MMLSEATIPTTEERVEVANDCEDRLTVVVRI